MAYLVDTLAMYILVDVLATQCDLFDRRMKETRSFEQTKLYHDEFLDAIIKQSLLAPNQAPIKNNLFNLFLVRVKWSWHRREY